VKNTVPSRLIGSGFFTFFLDPNKTADKENIQDYTQRMRLQRQLFGCYSFIKPLNGHIEDRRYIF